MISLQPAATLFRCFVVKWGGMVEITRHFTEMNRLFLINALNAGNRKEAKFKSAASPDCLLANIQFEPKQSKWKCKQRLYKMTKSQHEINKYCSQIERLLNKDRKKAHASGLRVKISQGDFPFGWLLPKPAVFFSLHHLFLLLFVPSVSHLMTTKAVLVK